MGTQTEAAPHMKKTFQLRRFSTLVLAGAFVVMLISGSVLFFGPHGQAAREPVWNFLGMTRIEWRAVHGALAGLFVLAGAVHVWLNRKPLFTYLKQRAGTHLVLSPELILALIVVVAFILAAWMGWIPLGMQESAGGGGGGPGSGLGLGRWEP